VLASLLAATLHGLDGRPIRVEVDVAPGLPGFTIVGLADTALQEARERVRAAIKNSVSGMLPSEMPLKRLILKSPSL
jgi:magnesium chelatase family protein